jgi:hypothetical protein
MSTWKALKVVSLVFDGLVEGDRRGSPCCLCNADKAGFKNGSWLPDAQLGCEFFG